MSHFQVLRGGLIDIVEVEVVGLSLLLLEREIPDVIVLAAFIEKIHFQ